MASNIFSRRALYRGLAYSSIGLGIAGIVLPLLPTTPFLLIAAWAAPRGSARLDHWLHTHPRLGPVLHAWYEQRAIPRRAKWLAGALLASSWLGLWLTTSGPRIPLFAGMLFLAIAVFVFTRPTALATREAS
ncbi:YbaN family protein [Halomonas sp. WWR20]